MIIFILTNEEQKINQQIKPKTQMPNAKSNPKTKILKFEI